MKTFKDCLIPLKERIPHTFRAELNLDSFYRIDPLLWQLFDIKKYDEKLFEVRDTAKVFYFRYENTNRTSIKQHNFSCPINYFLQNNPRLDYEDHFLVEVDRILAMGVSELGATIHFRLHVDDESPLIRCHLFLRKAGYTKRHFGSEQGLYIDRSFDKFIIEP